MFPLLTIDNGGGWDELYVTSNCGSLSNGIHTILFIGSLFAAVPVATAAVVAKLRAFNMDPVAGPLGPAGNDFRALGIGFLPIISPTSRTLIIPRCSSSIAMLCFFDAFIKADVELSMSSSIIIKLSSSELVSVLTIDKLSSATFLDPLAPNLAGVFSVELGKEMDALRPVDAEDVRSFLSAPEIEAVFSISVSFLTSKNGTSTNDESS